MENVLSGSAEMSNLTLEDIEDGLDVLMQDEQFEQDLINSFNDQMFIIKKTAPNPIWTLCSITMKMIRIIPTAEVIPISASTFELITEDSLVECLTGQNLVKIPKKFIQSGEWH
jgi:hypothetical protein